MAEGVGERGELTMPASPKSSRSPERNRRRTAAQQVLRTAAADALLEGTRPQLDEALRTLAARSAAIEREWRRLLRSLRPEREEFDALVRLDLSRHYGHLRAADYEAYLSAIQSEAEAMSRSGVPEENAVAALAFSLESCLGQLLPPEQQGGALALVRLTATIQRAVVLGYREARAEGWHRQDEQERLRLSRDLHDEIGADLVVLKLYIEMIAMELSRGNLAPAEAKLRESLALIGRAIESVRRLTLDLGPAILEQLGFVPALRLYARQFSERTGILVQLQDAGLPELPLPPAHETALYRVLQGALSNVAKHAQATCVKVTIGGFKDVLVMVIEDDGAGFDVDRAQRSFGITTMRDRVRGLGGRLHVESRPARGHGRRSGTRIEIDMPLKGGGP